MTEPSQLDELKKYYDLEIVKEKEEEVKEEV